MSRTCLKIWYWKCSHNDLVRPFRHQAEIALQGLAYALELVCHAGQYGRILAKNLQVAFPDTRP